MAHKSPARQRSLVENGDVAGNSVNLKSQPLVLAEDTPIILIEAPAATAASKTRRIRFDSLLELVTISPHRVWRF
jgi:hypothetical protein